MNVQQLIDLIQRSLLVTNGQDKEAIELIKDMESQINALKLGQCQWNAMFHQLDAVIGAALIDPENWRDWLELYMDNADTPWHLYTDADEFHRNYTMEFPMTTEEWDDEVARLNAVLEADMARDDE